MLIEMSQCMIVRAFPSQKNVSRLYIDVADLSSGAARFSFSSDTISLAEIQPQLNKVGSLKGEFELYIYDGKMQFKSNSVKFSPAKS